MQVDTTPNTLTFDNGYDDDTTSALMVQAWFERLQINLPTTSDSKTENMQENESIPKTPPDTRVVRFAHEEKKKSCHFLQKSRVEDDDDDCRAFYSHEEIMQMSLRAHKEAIVSQTNPARGLEDYTPLGKRQLEEVVEASRLTVLREQHRQRQERHIDTAALALLYRQVTRKSQDAAKRRGDQDEQDVLLDNP